MDALDYGDPWLYHGIDPAAVRAGRIISLVRDSGAASGAFESHGLSHISLSSRAWRTAWAASSQASCWAEGNSSQVTKIKSSCSARASKAIWPGLGPEVMSVISRVGLSWFINGEDEQGQGD